MATTNTSTSLINSLIQPTNTTGGLGVKQDASTLVSSKTSALLDPNSQLMQKAQTTALQSANSRGLLNSSMAVGAGTDAMLGKAQSLAQNDVDSTLRLATLAQQADSTNASNDLAQQTLDWQKNYQSYLLNSTNANNYANNIRALETSDMTAADKQAAMENLNIIYTGNSALPGAGFDKLLPTGITSANSSSTTGA
jgi:hypothetical protein